MSRTSLYISGSTGLIGHALLVQALLDDQVDSIVSISRKAVHIDSRYSTTKLLQATTSNMFDVQLPDTQNSDKIGAICLGTTIKQAGSKEALHRIDVKLVVSIAEKMKLLGVSKLAVVSSIGANQKSLSHYLRCKGEMESALKALNFEILYIAQPGPLAGVRNESRLGEQFVERVSKFLKPLFVGKSKNYYPIQGQTVASALLSCLKQKNTSNQVEVFKSIDLLKIANKTE